MRREEHSSEDHASVVGARLHRFIKAAVLCAELERRRDWEHVLINTGQHYDYAMSQIFFDELHMRAADISLEVGSAPHGEQTGEMLRRLEPALARVRPDISSCSATTNSTLAGALAAVKLGLPVVHVEAGLPFVRSSDARRDQSHRGRSHRCDPLRAQRASGRAAGARRHPRRSCTRSAIAWWTWR